MATGVQSWSKTASANATADSAVNWAEGQAPSSVNDSARGEMASVAKWRDDISGTLTTGGTSTAYTLTTNQGFATAAAMSGAKLCFIPHTTNGAAPTLAVDGLTARQIVTAPSTNVATGVLKQGVPYLVTYIHATTEFILMGALPPIIDALTAETSPDTADELALYDASAATVDKITLGNLWKAINTFTAETTLATDDVIAIYDTSEGAANKMAVSDALKIVNALTEDTSPDTANDFVMTYDASASSAKKVKPDNFGAISKFVLISAPSPSYPVSSVDFTGLSSTYDAYLLVCANVKVATDDVEVWLRVGTGGGPSYQTSGYEWATNTNYSGVGLTGLQSTSASSIVMCDNQGGRSVGNNTNEYWHCDIRFNNPDNTAPPHFNFSGTYANPAGTFVQFDGGGAYSSAGAITAIRIMAESGNLTAGDFALYGYKKT